MNKCRSASIMATLTGATTQAQTLQVAPRLVVNITIDQLRNDYIEQYSPPVSYTHLYVYKRQDTSCQ